MILLFDPAPPRLQWCLVPEGSAPTSASARSLDMRGDWRTAMMDCLPEDHQVKAIGCFLHNGGDEITAPIGGIGPDTIMSLERIVRLLPEHNEITLEVAKFWMDRRPEATHLLFCDTAFFAGLASSVRDYGLPYEVTQSGVHRYGGFGLCHERAWRQTQALTGGRASKVISVYLGDRPNLTAIRDGVPLDTSVGLTHLEGIVSSQGCGDIDPTIIFQLGAAGFSYPAINRLLSVESGFTALAGRPCTFADILGGLSDPGAAGPGPADSGLAAAYRILCYQIVKYIGAMLAALGGADALIFVGADPIRMMPLVRDLCDSLAFLGVRCQRETTGTPGPHQISTADSAVKVFVSGYDPWEMMSEEAREVIDNSEALTR